MHSVKTIVPKIALAGAASTLLAACATTPVGLPPVSVFASAETVPVGTMNEDAADDPAIWRHADDPSQSLIVATDKKAGLYVYDMAGQIKSFIEAPGLNNVALEDLGAQGVVVIASDRSDLANAKLHVSMLDTAAGTLNPIGQLPVGVGEGYGICLGFGNDGTLIAYSPVKEGTIYEQTVSLEPGLATQNLRTLSVPSQPEGCIVDPRDGTLYIGEEAAGIWRFAAGANRGELVAPVDNAYLVADVEGLAIAPEGDNGGYIVASSQGDNAYAVFQLPDMEPLGRFQIAAGEFGSTQETDGIELLAMPMGEAYPEGLFIAQDGQNAPEAQNFKLVSWGAIKAALGLD